MAELLGPYIPGPTDDENRGVYTGDAKLLSLDIPDKSYGYSYRNHDEDGRIKKGNLVDRMGYIYLLRRKSDGLYKIGQSDKTNLRLIGLFEIHDECELILIAKVPNVNIMEGKLHGFFTLKRIHNEWFDLTKTDVEHVRDLINRETI